MTTGLKAYELEIFCIQESVRDSGLTQMTMRLNTVALGQRSCSLKAVFYPRVKSRDSNRIAGFECSLADQNLTNDPVKWIFKVFILCLYINSSVIS